MFNIIHFLNFFSLSKFNSFFNTICNFEIAHRQQTHFRKMWIIIHKSSVKRIIFNIYMNFTSGNAEIVMKVQYANFILYFEFIIHVTYGLFSKLLKMIRNFPFNIGSYWNNIIWQSTIHETFSPHRSRFQGQFSENEVGNFFLMTQRPMRNSYADLRDFIYIFAIQYCVNYVSLCLAISNLNSNKYLNCLTMRTF